MMNRRFRDFFRCMVPMFVCLALQNGLMIFAAQVYLIYMFLGLSPGSEGQFSEQYIDGISSVVFLMGVSLVYAVCGVAVFAFWYWRMVRTETERGFWPNRSTERDSMKGYPVYLYGGILLFAIGAQYVCANIVAILAQARPDWFDAYAKLVENLDFSGNGAGVLVLLYTVFFGPLCEELCFRGLTLNYACRVMRPMTANLVQALFFGGMHANPLQSIYAFGFGYVLGMLYLETDNLWITISAHICFNALAMLLGEHIGAGSTPVSFYCIFLISMMAVYAGYLLIQKAQEEKEKIKEIG